MRDESALTVHVRENALGCLNELVTDALALVPDCLAYMRQIKHPEVFRFCAIPQVRDSLRLFSPTLQVKLRGRRTGRVEARSFGTRLDTAVP